MKNFIKHRKTARTEFEIAFEREMMASEIRRVTILVRLFGIGAIAFIVFVFLSRDIVHAVGIDHKVLPTGLFISIFITIFELIVLLILKILNKKGKTWPIQGRVMNTLVETSLPTIIILMLARHYSPVEMLFSPPSYLYLLFILMATLRLDFKLCFFSGLVATVGYVSLVIYFYADIINYSQISLLGKMPVHVLKASLYLGSGIAAGVIAIEIKKRFLNSLRSVEERNQVVEIFGRHVSPEVVNKLLAQKTDMESETRNVCVMFLDIRDFTSFSEKRTPGEVINYLNTLFDFMIDIINTNKGIINKFLGDGFMAVFGAPLSDGRDSQNAYAAALEILEELRKRNEGGDIPITKIGIGLHSGEAVTGNVGSVRRKEYTIIGDTVNLASRIEQKNKEFNSRLLISETVYGVITADKERIEELSPITVKGRLEPVKIYKVEP
ncbi:MAG: adenylate/guanylate cyclase domain-containing protein [bacterium]|nr:adenylate/guanylate cyclase domain-containing protein [bacterium]